MATETENQIGIIDILKQRNDTYQFLYRLYLKEVDKDLLAKMKAMRFPTRTGNALVDEGYREIVDFLEHADSNSISTLAVDYARTFLGSGVSGYSCAYPYESVYTSPKRLMMQGARDEVLALYWAEGLGKSETWKESEDHIAAELEFMTIIGQRGIDAYEAGDEDGCIKQLMVQRNFLVDHLLGWFPMMQKDMDRFPKTSFYTGLGKLTLGFLRNDRELLDDILASSEIEDTSEEARQESIDKTTEQNGGIQEND